MNSKTNDKPSSPESATATRVWRHEEIVNLVIDGLVAHGHVQSGELAPSTPFDILELDSLDVTELILDLEEQMSVDLGDYQDKAEWLTAEQVATDIASFLYD